MAERRISAVPLLLSFGRSARPRLSLAVGLAAVSALVGLVPYLVAYLVVDELLSDVVDESRLWSLVAVATGAIVLRALVYAGALWHSHVAAYGILYRVRVSLSEAMARLPLGYFGRRSSGSLKKTMADDVEQLELFLAHAIPDAAVAGTAFLASSVVLFAADWRLALATLAVVPLAFGVVSFSMRNTSRMDEYHRSDARMNGALVEFLQGMLVIRLFNRSADRIRQTEDAIADHSRFEVAWAKDFLYAGTFYFVAAGANVVVIVPVGLALYAAGSVSLSTLVLFLLLGIGYSTPLLQLQSMYTHLESLGAGGQAVQDVIDEPPLRDGVGTQRPASDTIEMRDVSFSYGEGEALSGVSFTARAGEVTALVGPSGAGKTTIVRLVARFWDVDAGSVTIGGVDVRDLQVSELMDRVAFIFQDSFLFHDTVAANIAFGRPEAGRDEIEAAARLARCHDFVTALPEGYDTVVGEGGGTLSGGQRQRLAIARALLKDAPIVVLDEATAHADPENEAAIQEAIAEATAGRTLLVIAHRLSTITDADAILVVDDGRVVERGRHEELLAAEGLYARLWEDHVHTAGWSLASTGAVEAGR